MLTTETVEEGDVVDYEFEQPLGSTVEVSSADPHGDVSKCDSQVSEQGADAEVRPTSRYNLLPQRSRWQDKSGLVLTN